MPENIYKSGHLKPINRLAASTVDAYDDDNISEDDIFGVKLKCDEIVANKSSYHKKKYDYIYEMIIGSRGSKRKRLLNLIKKHQLLRMPIGITQEHKLFMKRWASILKKERQIDDAKKKLLDWAESIKIERPPVIPPGTPKMNWRKLKEKNKQK